jgi:hypothetical protein
MRLPGVFETFGKDFAMTAFEWLVLIAADVFMTGMLIGAAYEIGRGRGHVERHMKHAARRRGNR